MDSNIKMKVMKNASVIQKENGFGRLLKFDCSDGLGLMTVYNVFPGIELIYNEFETTEFSWKNNTSGNVMEINHCREGREGSQLKNGAYLYLGEGDLSIHMMDNCAPVMSFPLKHYRGVSESSECSCMYLYNVVLLIPSFSAICDITRPSLVHPSINSK